MQLFRRFPLLNLKQQKLFSSKTTTYPQEKALFEKLIADWWDPQGRAKILHGMNTLRVPLVKNGLINRGVVTKENIYSLTPLKGLSILDVGCGGGILSEALALLGAEVTGIDADPNAIDLAKHHALKNNISINNYLSTSIDEYATKNVEKFDAIAASEVIKHVTDKVQFIEACAKCLRPSGSIFVTTLNKTIFTDVFAIYVAENIFNLIPKGTHQIEECIGPEQLQTLLEYSNFCASFILTVNVSVFCGDYLQTKDTPEACFTISSRMKGAGAYQLGSFILCMLLNLKKVVFQRNLLCKIVENALK